MVDRIGNGAANLARTAIEAAMKRSNERASQLGQMALSKGEALGKAAPESKSAFSTQLSDGMASVVEQTNHVDKLPEALVTGKITDIHQVAAQLKQAELSLKFALEVRNKFIDAYREVMRMSV